MSPPEAAPAPTKIQGATIFLANGERIEISGQRIAGVGNQDGTVQIVELLDGGSIRRWFNMPCSITYEPPSGLVIPAPRLM